MPSIEITFETNQTSTGKTNFRILVTFINCNKPDTAKQSDSTSVISGALGGSLFLVLLVGVMFYAKRKRNNRKLNLTGSRNIMGSADFKEAVNNAMFAQSTLFTKSPTNFGNRLFLLNVG